MPYADPIKSREYHTRKSKEWYKKYPEKRAKIARTFHQSEAGRKAKRKYRLKDVFWTPEKYEKALVEQEGKCDICREAPTKGKLGADHDHIRKIPRGLLCNACNFILGQAKDKIDTLENAITYLRKHNSDAAQADQRSKGTT